MWLSPCPPHDHKPRPRPALAEGQVLQVGADLVPGRLDGLGAAKERVARRHRLLGSQLRSAGQRPDVELLGSSAARVDDVRASYGHWLREIRKSRTGLLLQPDLSVDGDLLGVRLPRRVSTPMRAGRGFLVANGEARLVQIATSPASVP